MRVGSVSYAVEQGLGRLMKMFYDAHIITDPVIYKHSHWQRKLVKDWYPIKTPMLEARRSFDLKVVGPVIDQVHAMLFFETPFDWDVFRYCKDHGVKTILMPMYEWFPITPPALPDLFLCPSLLDLAYFKDNPKYQGTEVVFLPVPVNTDHWKPRTRATKFLHNAGNVGHREHKGTRQLLEAAKLLKTPLELTVRAQDASALRRIVEGVFGREVAQGGREELVLDPVNPEFGEGKGPRLTIKYGQIAHADLWSGYDVYVAPEKFNGLSLPLQEACAAGMVVMTTNRYPMNTWLPSEPLIPVAGYTKARIGAGYLEFDEATVSPETIAAKMDAWYGRDIRELSQRGYEWAQANSWTTLKQLYQEVLTALIEGRPVVQPVLLTGGQTP